MSLPTALYSVPEFATILGKSPQRVYQMMHEGLLQETGIGVYRTRKGRVWLSTIAASSDPLGKKGDLG